MLEMAAYHLMVMVGERGSHGVIIGCQRFAIGLMATCTVLTIREFRSQQSRDQGQLD